MGTYRKKARDAQITLAVASSRSIAQALRALGLQALGGNYRTIHSAVARLALDTSHWLGQGHRKGATWPMVPSKLEEVLVAGRHYTTSRLRKRLITERLLEALCSRCRLSEWQGNPIPLELDHIDGDAMNNQLSNLRLLCPNCHALTPTYRGRNKGRRRANSANMPQARVVKLVDTGDLRR